MNISRINLNLLIALDALLDEKNVTKAGKKLFITQAAMSNVLKKLRSHFNDPLLLQVGKRLVPTPYADRLHPVIKSWLVTANSIFNPGQFDAKTSKRHFTLAIDEFTDVLVLPRLYKHIEKHASLIELDIKHILPNNENTILTSNDIDLAICSLSHSEKVLNASHEILFREKIVCLGRKNHPLFKSTFTLKKYLTAKHIALTSKSNNTPHLVDYILHNLGYQRHISLRTTNIAPALYTVANSDLIATLPEGLAKEAARIFKAVIKPCPFPISPATFAQVWHPFTETDEGCQWLRNTLKQLLK